MSPLIHITSLRDFIPFMFTVRDAFDISVCFEAEKNVFFLPN